MENFFHVCPPLSFRNCFERFLTGLANIPPSLGNRICSHFIHVRLEVISDVLKLGKQLIVLQVDGIIPDVTLGDHL